MSIPSTILRDKKRKKKVIAIIIIPFDVHSHELGSIFVYKDIGSIGYVLFTVDNIACVLRMGSIQGCGHTEFVWSTETCARARTHTHTHTHQQQQQKQKQALRLLSCTA